MIERNELENFLPHKGTMFLLDRVTAFDIDQGLLTSETDIAETDLFYNAALKGVPAWVGFEYMAQSIAALSGLNARTRLGQKPKIGFIMSVRDFSTKVHAFAAGSKVVVDVKQLFRDGDVVAFNCSIQNGDGVAVSAVINAIETTPEEAMKRGGANV